MPWKMGRPQPSWDDHEKLRWNHESYDRTQFNSFTWTPPSVGANTTKAFVVSASGPDVVSNAPTGLRKGAGVTISPPAVLPSQVSLYAFVTASDSLTIAIVNPTASPVTPPSGTWSFSGMVI